MLIVLSYFVVWSFFCFCFSFIFLSTEWLSFVFSVVVVVVVVVQHDIVCIVCVFGLFPILLLIWQTFYFLEINWQNKNKNNFQINNILMKLINNNKQNLNNSQLFWMNSGFLSLSLLLILWTIHYFLGDNCKYFMIL